MRFRPGVQVAHHDDVRSCCDQLRDVAQLLEAGAPAQRQVQHDDPQPRSTFAITQHQRASARNSTGQAVFFDFIGNVAPKYAVAGMGDDADLAVGLMGPPRKVGLFGQVLDLVDEAGTKAAAVDFLQADDVEIRCQRRDRFEVRYPLIVGQHLAPTAGNVFAVAGSGGPGLDVEAHQLQHPAGLADHGQPFTTGGPRTQGAAFSLAACSPSSRAISQSAT